MTEKQKQAIKVLNSLMATGVINDEDFFVLLEFVVDNPNLPQQPTITTPWIQPITYPTTPWLDPIFRITCNGETISGTQAAPIKSTFSDATKG